MLQCVENINFSHRGSRKNHQKCCCLHTNGRATRFMHTNTHARRVGCFANLGKRGGAGLTSFGFFLKRFMCWRKQGVAHWQTVELLHFCSLLFLLHLSFFNVNIIFKFLQPQNWQHSRLDLRTFKFGYLTF